MAPSTRSPPPRRFQPVQNYRAGREPKPGDIWIALMGVTGSGKSSFIAKCTEGTVKVGATLRSCTSSVDVYAYDLPSGKTIYLIDTPGFDDTQLSDTQVLKKIASWLADSYKNSDILLNGIIYLHRITDVRLQGSAKKNLLMFKKLCGKDYLAKVSLVTTMWDTFQPGNESVGSSRENELIKTPDFWGFMMDNGSRCDRYFNTTESARQIVLRLAKIKGPVVMSLQKEMVHDHLRLDETSAGQELRDEFRKEKEKWARERREIEEQMREAMSQQDQKLETMMREERDKYSQMIKAKDKDVHALRVTMENLLAEQKAAHARELEEMRKMLAREEELNQDPETAHRMNNCKVQQRPYRVDDVGHSVAVSRNKIILLSANRVASNTDNPPQVVSRSWLISISLGYADNDDDIPFICQYDNGKWCKSDNLVEQYPRLGRFIRMEGLQNLDYVSLGVAPSYYARFKNKTWSAFGSPEYMAHLGNIHRERLRSIRVALGHNDSYFISYDYSWMITTRYKHIYDLKGYYPRLLTDLQRDNSSIHRVTYMALDPQSTTDFIVVYKRASSKGTYRKYSLSDIVKERLIRDWWRTT